jgi:hypothetical protein
MSLLQRDTWGPCLWKILHTFANRSGSITNKILEDDEAHAWINVFKTLDNIMPCDLCIQHYKAALKKTNINELLITRGLARNRWLTEFWYNLHNDVNSRSNKSTFEKDDLKIYDDKVGFDLAHDMIKKVVAKGIEQGTLHMIVAKNGLTRIETLRRVYGL